MDGSAVCLLFFVTGGRGTESFVAKEVEQKLSPVCVSSRDGKVFFKLSLDEGTQVLSRILALKSVERAFISITDYDNSLFIKGKREFLDKLMAELSTKTNFENAAVVLKQMSSLLSLSKTKICEFSQKQPAQDAVDVIQQPSSSEQACTTNKNQNQTENHICVNISQPHDVATASSMTNDKSVSDYEPAIKFRKLANSLNNKSCSTDTLAAENIQAKLETPRTYEIIATCEKKTEARVDSSTSLDSMPNVGNNCNGCPLTFRMSIKASGKVSRWLNIKKLSRDVGWRVAKASGWTVDLKKPSIEVCVHISDEHVTAGVPLTRIPLSKRDYLMDSGLRAPIAWIINQLADIQPGDIVLDPMCGKATILMEAFSEMQAAYYMGGDTDSSQIKTAEQNLRNSGANGFISLIKANGLNLPYRDEMVDAVLCDAPFNNKHLISATPEIFFNQFLKEIFRVLRPNGRCVLLVSQEMKDMVMLLAGGMEVAPVKGEKKTSSFYTGGSQVEASSESECDSKMSFDVFSSHYVKLGETHACIIVLNKCISK